MSLRAIRKRENTNPYKKYSAQPVSRFPSADTTRTRLSSLQSAEHKHNILGKRLSYSNPDLRKPTDTLEILTSSARLVRRKSESDVLKLLQNCSGNIASAKSEVCLKTISVHTVGIISNSRTKSTKGGEGGSKMISGARSHRDLMHSSYADVGAGSSSDAGTAAAASRRRLSENSLSGSSQRTNAMSASAITISPSHSSECDVRSGYSDTTTAAVRVPIIGYEVMEERARFTVYKLRVENPFSNDCWLVLRRYTDFVRLNTKLKQAFPSVTLHLPRKKIFGDNFNSVFLDNRVQGLQMFVNSIMAKEELRKFKIVREFFCLDEPPTYSESMEECRAIFEAQEETIAHLKMQINSKNELILNLQQKLREELIDKEDLQEALKNISVGCPKCTPNGSVKI